MFIQRIICGVFHLSIWVVIYSVIVNTTDGITDGLILNRRNNSLTDGPAIDFSVIFLYTVDGVDDINRQAYNGASFDLYDELYINSTHTVYYIKNNPSVAKLMPINEISDSLYYILIIGIIIQALFVCGCILYNASTCKKETLSIYRTMHARIV